VRLREAVRPAVQTITRFSEGQTVHMRRHASYTRRTADSLITQSVHPLAWTEARRIVKNLEDVHLKVLDTHTVLVLNGSR
jgi:hypothetical protein